MVLLKQFKFVFQSVLVGLAIAAIILIIDRQLNNGSDRYVSGPDSVLSFDQAISRASPAVVNIYASKILEQHVNPLFRDPLFQRFFGTPEVSPNRLRDSNLGSGVMMHENGYILTNAHVINGMEEIRVTLIDGRQVFAGVMGIDAATDLALLEINADNLQAIPIGNSDLIKVGDIVLAIGNPFDFGQTVTQGIVSAVGRNRMGITTYENFIQTDADINPGNSGGALINSQGELIGINTAIISSTGGSQGIGLATPVNQAIEVMSQLITNGRVIRGWLGIEAQILSTETIRETGLVSGGILVAGTLKGGPADNAGIKPGDIIISVSDQIMLNPQQAIYSISRFRPGTQVDIRVLRGWDEIIFQATVAERPDFENTRAK